MSCFRICLGDRVFCRITPERLDLGSSDAVSYGIAGDVMRTKLVALNAGRFRSPNCS